MTSENSIPSRGPALTRPQWLVLCALLGTMTSAMAWVAFSFYKASLPPVKQLVRDGSIVGRSIDSIRYWQGDPDAECRVEGWDVTYSSSDTLDKKAIAALKLNTQGVVTDCRLYFNDGGPYASTNPFSGPHLYCTR